LRRSPNRRHSPRANDLVEIDASRHIRQPILGLVKVVALNVKRDAPELGIVGNQRQMFDAHGSLASMTETGLHPVAEEILMDDLTNIRPICQ
jgi:hypothetical protein